MELQSSVFEDQCFQDFFPRQNSKYASIYESIRNIDDYDWNSYVHLLEADKRKNKNYCKRKCFNQRFSPSKYNKQKNLYPEKQELIEFIQLMDADPTENKGQCLWTIENRNQILDLDILNVKRNIQIYLENFPKKPLPSNYEELLLDVSKTLYNLKGEYEDNDTISVLYEGKEGTLLVPLTIEASCKYGKGTKWCTAANTSENFFEYYSNRGPLYIWITRPNMKKYQFYFNEFEFKDMLDEHVPKSKILYFRNQHPILSQLWKDGERMSLDNLIKNSYSNSKKTRESNFINRVTVVGLLIYYIRMFDMNWPEFENLMYEDDKVKTYIFEFLLNFLKNQGFDIIASMHTEVTYENKQLKNEEIYRIFTIMLLIDNLKMLGKKFNYPIGNELDPKIELALSRIQEIFKYLGINIEDFLEEN